MSEHRLEIPHDNAYVRVQFPCMPSASTMARVGGVANIVRATAADEDAADEQVLTFQMADSAFGPIVSSTRDTSGARLLLRVVADANGRVKPNVIGVVRTAFSFDGLADYLCEGAVDVHERAFPALDRRDFLNSDLEPLVLRPSWSLAGSDRPADLNLAAPPRPKARPAAAGAAGGDGADFTATRSVRGEAPQPQPPAVDPVLAESETFKRLSEMFAQRPVWSPRALQARFDWKEFDSAQYVAALAAVAYRFTGGPFRRQLVRYGYDPRLDPGAARYQSVDVRFRDDMIAVTQAYTAQIKQRDEQLLRNEELRIINDAHQQFNVQLVPSDSAANAGAEARFMAAANGVSPDVVKKAEAYRRTQMSYARKRLAQMNALEQVTFAQAPTMIFSLLPLEDLRAADPVVRDLLAKSQSSTFDARWGWLSQSTYDEIVAHLKARADAIMTGTAVAASPAEPSRKRNVDADAAAFVPDNYAVARPAHQQRASESKPVKKSRDE